MTLRLNMNKQNMYTYTCTLFPKEAMTVVNGKKGWLNRNGDFYPEDVVKKATEDMKIETLKHIDFPMDP